RRCYTSFRVLSVFFFQAEDGIRDFHVTGVQTCALPISASIELPGLLAHARAHILAREADLKQRSGQLSADDLLTETCRALKVPRSEERRVGKECRSRWWPCHRQMKTQEEVRRAKWRI